MEKENAKPALIRKKTLLLLASVYVVVILALLFHTLDRWKRSAASGPAASGPATTNNINMNLPIAQVRSKDTIKGKMEAYEKAAKDSDRMEQQRKQDPNWARP